MGNQVSGRKAAEKLIQFNVESLKFQVCPFNLLPSTLIFNAYFFPEFET